MPLILTDQTLIRPRWLVPVVPKGVVLENHALLVQDDKIQDILPASEAEQAYPAARVLKLDSHLLTAGLVNVHGHAAMTLLRGYADDRELMDWLNNHIWPVEGKLVSYDFVRDGSMLAAAEMISGGTTSIADTYFFPDAVAEAFGSAGIRGQIGLPVVQFPNAWASSEEEHLRKAIELHLTMKDHELLHNAIAPHAPYTVTNEGFENLVREATQHDLPVHLHLHETEQEVTEAIATHGNRPIARMQSLGLMNERLQTIHMTQLTEQEIILLAESGAHVAHCPESNMKLASGTCPVAALQAAGVNVGIGTDGAASNNNLDMLEEARSAAFLSKLATADATSLGAHSALQMATLDGARLLGIDDKVGSLETGKQADLMAVDFSDLSFQPVHNPVSLLIYTATCHQVSHTWVNGRLLYENGVFHSIDTTKLAAVIEEWHQKIRTIV